MDVVSRTQPTDWQRRELAHWCSYCGAPVGEWCHPFRDDNHPDRTRYTGDLHDARYRAAVRAEKVQATR